jgi:hypothetical protein
MSMGFQHVTIGSLAEKTGTIETPHNDMSAYRGLQYICAHTGETLIFDPNLAVVGDGAARVVVRRGRKDSRCSVVRLSGPFPYPLKTEAATIDRRMKLREAEKN